MNRFNTLLAATFLLIPLEAKEHFVQNIAVQKAGQMPLPLKAAVEQILGRPIGADEEISVVAVPPQHVVPSEGRAAVVAKLEVLLNWTN